MRIIQILPLTLACLLSSETSVWAASSSSSAKSSATSPRSTSLSTSSSQATTSSTPVKSNATSSKSASSTSQSSSFASTSPAKSSATASVTSSKISTISSTGLSFSATSTIKPSTNATSISPHNSSGNATRSTSSSVPSASSTQSITSSPLLLAIINAHTWQQYKFQAIGCLTNPSLYSDCSEIYTCYNIPSYSSALNEIIASYYDFNYQYTDVRFYGFNRANYTAIGPTLRNATAAVMYDSCLVNSTCAKVMSGYSTSVVQSTLQTYVSATFNAILNAIPADGSRTYLPYGSNTNALSIFTAAATFGQEVYGVHDAITLAAGAGNFTLSQLQAIQKMGVYLSGGASVYERMMMQLAFYGWDCFQGVIGDPATDPNFRRRDTTLAPSPVDLHKSAIGSINYVDKYHDLDVVSHLRGSARSVLKTMTMDRYFANLSTTLEPTFSQFHLHPRTCESLDNVNANIVNIQSIARGTCGVLGVLGGLFDIGEAIDGAGALSNWLPALKLASNVQYNTLQITLTSVSTLCTVPGLNSPCYPSPGVYTFDDAETAGTVFALLKDLVVVGVKGASGTAALTIGFDVACAALPIALQAYQNAAACCASNCNSPVCYAASIACAITGLQC